MNDIRRQKILEELEDYLELDDAPADALTRTELCEMLGIGKARLNNALEDLDKEGKLFKSRIRRRNKLGNYYWTTVYWFGDD
jgi:predicted transcriptional regulator